VKAENRGNSKLDLGKYYNYNKRMKFGELVKLRYSCRKYKEKPVEREKIAKCIEAARRAPSACNAQPWKFIVLDEESTRCRAASAASSGKYRFSRFIKGAPVLILVLARKSTFLAAAGSFVRNTEFYLIDIGIACEHVVLQASELNLGSCYVGWFNEKKLKKMFGIPSKISIPLLLTIGYPDEKFREKDVVRKRASSDRRNPVDEILFYNGFGESGKKKDNESD